MGRRRPSWEAKREGKGKLLPARLEPFCNLGTKQIFEQEGTYLRVYSLAFALHAEGCRFI